MARIPVVSRTITTTDASVMCVNINTGETETKTFTLYALGTDVSYQSSVQTDDGNQVFLESTLKEWDEVESTIASIVGKTENTNFTVSRSLGTITVTAPP